MQNRLQISFWDRLFTNATYGKFAQNNMKKIHKLVIEDRTRIMCGRKRKYVLFTTEWNKVTCMNCFRVEQAQNQ